MGTEKRTEKSYGVIPVFRTKKSIEVLLVQHHAGHWGFPKGHAKKGEDPVSAARREFEEETGIAQYELLLDLKFKERYDTKRKGSLVRKKVRYYVAFVEDQAFTIQEEELQDGRWFSPDKAAQRLTFPESKDLFQKALRALTKHLAD